MEGKGKIDLSALGGFFWEYLAVDIVKGLVLLDLNHSLFAHFKDGEKGADGEVEGVFFFWGEEFRKEKVGLFLEVLKKVFDTVGNGDGFVIDVPGVYPAG